jgi:hypothetical protein
LSGASDRWPELPFEDRRKIVEAIIEKILIGNGEILSSSSSSSFSGSFDYDYDYEDEDDLVAA